MTVDGDIGFKSSVNSFGERLGRLGLLCHRRDNGEFVAADARQEGAVAGRLEPPRHFPQQRVADRMAEHVVDGLEAVEIDA